MSDNENRNNDALFGAEVNKQLTGTTREQVAKQEFGIEIPIDAVPLPSKGLVYPSSHPLHKAESVEYRAMTTREEDILMSTALIKKGTVITELIKSCLIDKKIDVPSLLVGDRTTLMIGIRSTGYSPEYKPTVVCPKCETKNELNIDLSQLALKTLTITPVHPFTNTFEFELPKSKKKIWFQFATGEVEEKIIQEMNVRKKKGFENTQLITTRLQHSIVAIDGNSDKGTINKFIQFMPAIDSNALRKFIDDNEPGVDMTHEFTCRGVDCEYSDKINIPIDASFLWPNAG